MIIFKAQPGGNVNGSIRVPGDKSISHRSIMLGSLAEGTTTVEGFLEGEDSLATLKAFQAMGVEIEGPNNGKVQIHGVGLNGLCKPEAELDMGNSGTSMRLLAGLMSGQAFDVTMIGDESLSKRPMRRVSEPLKLMGADVQTQQDGTPPLTTKGSCKLKGVHYDMPIASAQVKSCMLLAGLYAEGETSVTEPAPTRDHTERMLKGFGYPVTVEGSTAKVAGTASQGKLTACHINVPADISSAAFFMVAAAITEDSDLTLQHVGINPTRVGILNILKQMGANIELLDERESGGEPVADIRIRHSQLRGIDIPVDQVPLAIDEMPVLFIAAANAEGITRLRGAEELRVKESDRIAVMAEGLKAIGVEYTEVEDGIDIVGFGGTDKSYHGGTVNSHHDHRIAMSFAVAALNATDDIIIEDCANVATSFPNFLELAQSVGMRVAVLK